MTNNKNILPPGSQFYDALEMEEFLRTGISPQAIRQWEQSAREDAEETEKAAKRIAGTDDFFDFKEYNELVNEYDFDPNYTFTSREMRVVNRDILRILRDGETDPEKLHGFNDRIRDGMKSRDERTRCDAAHANGNFAQIESPVSLELASESVATGVTDSSEAVQAKHLQGGEQVVKTVAKMTADGASLTVAEQVQVSKALENTTDAAETALHSGNAEIRGQGADLLVQAIEAAPDEGSTREVSRRVESNKRRSLDSLIAAAHDDDPEVRMKAIRGLGRIAAYADGEKGEAAMQALKQISKADESPEVKEAAAVAMDFADNPPAHHGGGGYGRKWASHGGPREPSEGGHERGNRRQRAEAAPSPDASSGI